MIIIEDVRLVKPKRHHRKSRIAKKWLKRYGVRPDKTVYVHDNHTIQAHPETAVLLREHWSEEQRRDRQYDFGGSEFMGF